ncbi:phage tail sheath family protein [Aquimarina longa]|uniref:phage tail sheath family protein n=1 Tax=Aquimarina longa TaxID=1080221 RepID=UPI000781BABB|nr:phage tail sheath C-terminal domain-containing protein [Aquimarina longa]
MLIKTPGVYIKEKRTVATAVNSVATAVPLFIGFTEHAHSEPIKINSLAEFENIFGGAYLPKFTINIDTTNNQVKDVIPDKRFFLYDSIILYFKNGGGSCYIKSASIETYDTVTSTTDFNSIFTTAINLIDVLDEVTLILIPDLHFQFKDVNNVLVSLNEFSLYKNILEKLINKCGNLQDKFAIIDFHQSDSLPNHIRGLITPHLTNLKHAAVYYPWLKNANTYQVKLNSLSLDDINSGSAIEQEAKDILYDVDTLSKLFGVDPKFDRFDKEEYKKLINKISTTNTPNDKINFSRIFVFFYYIITRFDIITNPAHPAHPGNQYPSNYGRLLKNPIVKKYILDLRSNEYFVKTVQKLYRFKGMNTSKIDPLYGWPGPYNPWSNQWFNNPPNTNKYSLHENVEVDTNLLSDYTVGSKTPSEIINDLDSGKWVDLNVFLSAVEGLRELVFYQKEQIEKELFATDPIYVNIKKIIEEHMKKIPSQGAIAGIYCKNDRERGVWKSPANITIQGIEKPLIEISNSIQDELNVDINTGKSINVIRRFTGRGSLIWGARTLAGNDNEWRYIAVRRFFNFAEKSIKNAIRDFVFEPNDTRTWVKIKAIIYSFLVVQWDAGALTGATMKEAFFIKIGEEITSPKEILEGKVNIQIGMAVTRPAEFITIQFIHLFNEQ